MIAHEEDQAEALRLVDATRNTFGGVRWNVGRGDFVTAAETLREDAAALIKAADLLTPKPVVAAEVRVAA